MTGQVISISGPPGSGKSALSKMMAQAFGASVVSYDDFETMTRQPMNETLAWLERGAPYDDIATPGLADALEQARAQGPVIFDTPLGRSHGETGAFIDVAVWIDCPLDVALSRKIAQLTQGVPPEHTAGFVEWLSAYLTHYETIIRPACLIQKDRLGEACDVKANACFDLLEVAQNLEAQLRTKI